MGNTKSLINIGELSKPAVVLIEKISDALGGLFKPWQTVRVARADAQAEGIRAAAQIEITDLHRRALTRFVAEQAQRQANMESITRKALDDLEDEARPEEIQNDWISNFFDKCRLISDEEMQNLWAKVLAGEANTPGKYSRRTVNLLGSLDKGDATLFRNLCCFAWNFGDEGEWFPLIYDYKASMYTSMGLTFNGLTHLDAIGLITYSGVQTYSNTELAEVVKLSYHGSVVQVDLTRAWRDDFDRDRRAMSVGHVLLTQMGEELAPISGATPVSGFADYVLRRLTTGGCVVSSPWPREKQ